jgi:hypothetical protein
MGDNQQPYLHRSRASGRLLLECVARVEWNDRPLTSLPGPATIGAMVEPTLRIDEIQTEVQEIAEVLQREQPDKTIAEVWEEALSLHRVRYETKVLPPRQTRSGTRRWHTRSSNGRMNPEL